ncbi:DNA repair ATPase [Aureliella helgolandensis]|uniref:ATPase involved in DNA repair n=1 Tax=Aureliella helgolandensis TaxID=2527968 RepID=A0A518G936_9BACT|nr:DNA repair ATPase [Aureliella helgolandensis]QDV25082.1 ATPase involved in DNA repair [Aureliella helgolandensis]
MTESLGSGTYDVLRNRLREAANELRERFEQLNAARSDVFGNIETKLCSTAHVSTDHNCVPRDLLSIGDCLLLAYNVQFGLKTEIDCTDVFSFYRFDGEIAHSLPLSNLFDERFQRDFKELYRYYKNTTFARFFTAGPFVYFVFQVGKSVSDVKAFKWAVEGDELRYVDNRGDQDVRLPEQHGFRWLRATRDQHRSGVHPHVSIEDLVFVECVGGDLTIKVEDNTEDGSGIYAEPVDNPDQTLDDAEVYYSILGNLVLLKMRPYQEKDFRYFVFSVKRQAVQRLDAIAQACVLLPDDHGIIFPGGVFLQTGSCKLFDHGLDGLAYERTIAAQNGEDYLYLFTDLKTGTYLHLRYNLIRQEVDTPLVCHGQTLFDDGRMVTFRGDENPQKHHALQLWQTPYVGANFKAEMATDSMLYKIGNRELVRGMAECQELLQLIDKDDSYAELYSDLTKRSTDVIDSYFWLDREETFRFAEPIAKIRDAASAAVEEFDKVVRVRRETEQQLRDSAQATQQLLAAIQRSSFDSVTAFVEKLAAIRTQRGHAIGLRELRFIDLPAVEELETQLSEAATRLGLRCVQFLLTPSALDPYRKRIVQCEGEIPEVHSASEGRQLQEQLLQISSDLELLIETVSQLKIEDLTQRTAITDETGNLLADLNRIRSALKSRVRELLSGEMEADFASQTKLLDQAAAGALENADTPDKVDESLTRTMLQLEELEGRFAEFDELLMRLTEKRQSLYEAFEARRQQLVEARSRRAEGIVSAANRILQGISSRAQRMKDADALRSYFASDPMVDKVRQLANQLQELGDSVRMEDVLTRLKTVSDDALRQLRDRQDLFTGDDGQIKLGRHFFSINSQATELTTVVRDGLLQLHLTGTQFYQPLRDEVLNSSRDLWQQLLPSENDAVYRGEFLAASLFDSAQSDQYAYLQLKEKEQIDWVRSQMQSRHAEGYSRGVHDQDATKILTALLNLDRQLGLLRTAPAIRATAWYVWQYLVPNEEREQVQQWISGFDTISTILPEAQASGNYVARLSFLLEAHGAGILFDAAADDTAGPSLKTSTIPSSVQSNAVAIRSRVCTAAHFLMAQLREQESGFVASPRSLQAFTHLKEHLPSRERQRLNEALSHNRNYPSAAWTLAMDAVSGFLRRNAQNSSLELDPLENYQHEIALLLLIDDKQVAAGPKVEIATRVGSLVGDHPRLKQGELGLHYHEFRTRLEAYRSGVLPRFYALRDTKHQLLVDAERRLRTSEFKPRVLTSFVRNKLIDDVYLPLIGDNLAKQMGASGEAKRTDRMGLLLLISPPGYGKTTLMEYVANRLGLVFVKVNGPALGHNVTSLDPAEAPNVSAREEVERINLALEMGDNVMLYLDDIQHCNPELLQKFIPLCDATRRIEGVWQGEAKTYDLRGRKVVVVMAGNPYTESGDRFQIPDMLSNRADVYNLGEIIGDSREAFELSYIENCLTSNTVLQSLAKASSRDQRAVIQAASRGTSEGLELESNMPPDQLSDAISVIAKLLRVRDVILRVNRAYIRSAGQVDAYRTEPSFKLQGSYRNMNRIAERVVSVMNESELETLIMANYEQDAQTLTRDGESNLLKFKELLGSMTPAEADRWEQIKYAFVESVRMQGIEGEDSTAQVLRSLVGLKDGLESIRRTLAQALASSHDDQHRTAMQEGIAHLSASLTSIGGQLSDSISASTTRLEKSGSQLPDQKVLVQHSVPRVMTDLVRSQFQLLYDGLRPVLESSAMSGKQLEALRTSIDNCLQQYRDLQREIESSHDKDSE